MRSIKELKNLKGKRVILRVDFNVPIKNGVIEDDFRIQKSLLTIDFLLKKGAKILIITHLGKDGSQSLEGVIKRFFQIAKLNKEEKSRIEFFENIRKFEGEEKNEPNFAKQLAKLGDIYVNDAFSVSHRSHASVVGITRYLPNYAGFQLLEEVQNLSKVIKNPKHPFLFILGGAKFSTKMPLIKKYLKLADYVFIGGALLSDFLKAKGFEIGKSLVDDENYGIERILRNKRLIIPEFVVVKNNLGKFEQKNIKDVLNTDTILDVGEKSIENISLIIQKSKLILWNGPLGKYEDGGDKATKILLNKISKTKAISIIGGGDTVELISELKMQDKFTFVSTGGGATLDFLSKGTLSAIKALR